MRRLLFASTGAALFMLAVAPKSADAALICKEGHFYYSGSEFYANRLQAEANAIEAWRRVKAGTYGATHAAKLFPKAEQLHCARATKGEGWRCFIRGGPCHTS